jgi:hypothetical protein
MRTSFPILAAACLVVVSCEKEQETPVSPAPESVEATPAPAAVPVKEDEFKIGEEEPAENTPAPTPGQRLDQAIEKTEEGIGTAKEKTEEGIRKAAEKTGQFLQRAGEKIEKAGE